MDSDFRCKITSDVYVWRDVSSPNSLNFPCWPGLVLLLAAVLTSGCGRDEISVYTVPKEQTAPLKQVDLPADHSAIGAPAAGPRLKWKTPEGWKEVQLGEFRVASFSVNGKDGKKADVSVIPLPGSAGGDVSNVNRWRSQVGQKPV